MRSDRAGISEAGGWQQITPDAHGDWLNQRDDSFSDFIVLGDKKSDNQKLFENFSLGIATNRDAWCYNPSKQAVANNMQRMIRFYNQEVARFVAIHSDVSKANLENAIDHFIDANPTKISWTRALKQDLGRGRRYDFEISSLTASLYRPFTKQWLYYNRRFNEMVLQMPRIFPDVNAENLVIQVNANYKDNGFIALISDALPDLHCNGDSQCFPLYLYDEAAEAAADATQAGLFDAENVTNTATGKSPRRDAITDEGLAHFQSAYPHEAITKEDLFYYIYGILHSPEYRERYADNLSKELPRIPRVKTATDFWAFSRAGRELAKWHLNYETITQYPAKIDTGGKVLGNDAYRVEKMRYGKRGKDKDLSTIIYNPQITVSGIPLEAYEYVVNSKSAIDWVMERQCVKTDKASGIVNDANDWATETMHNPRYPLELLLRVITVSIETMKIVRSLPKLDILES